MAEKIKCPKCGNKKIVKKGKRKNLLRIVQLYRCNNCGKIFSFETTKSKTYPINAIMYSLIYYNQGFTLEQASKLINKQFKIKSKDKTVHSWVKEFKDICSFHRFRNGLKDYIRDGVSGLIFEKAFKHLQVYKFKYHRAKLDLFVNRYFFSLRRYLESVSNKCPDSLFENSLRGSELRIKQNVFVRGEHNRACELVGLALKIPSSNKKRHEAVQDFMLSNDTATIAVEVPVYLDVREIPNFRILEEVRRLGKPITGHIDIVQLKFGNIFLLDYKPNAAKERNAVSQLFCYALALSIRTNIYLRNFRCAWFDEKDYFEFNPSELVLKNETLCEKDLAKYKIDFKANRYFTSKKFQEDRKKGIWKKEEKGFEK